MLRYELGDAEFGDVRFAVSPLSEMGLSLRVLRAPDRFPLQLGWIRATEDAREQVDLSALRALVSERMHTPDFLNPYSTSPVRRLDDELAELEGISVAEFRRQLVASHGYLPAPYDGRGRAPVRRMLAALREYWDTCLGPHWARMRAVLEADIVHRGRVMAQQGTSVMLADLAPNLSLRGSVLEVHLRSGIERTEAVGGSGLVLVPTLFTRRASVPVLPALGASIMYAARGQGAMWSLEDPRGPAALGRLIGPGRARVLASLAEPVSTTTLATRLGVTPSAVSQHLGVLARSGLVSSARHGRSVLYLRSDLGERLVAGG